MKIAFYAPLKSPDHPNPSGDRTIARLLLSALQQTGFDVRLVSTLRSRDGRGDPDYQKTMIAKGQQAVEHLLHQWQQEGYQPDYWFTYHVYYKAPDLLGPLITKTLQIPYWLAEASWATKRAQGPWHLYHEQVYQALQQAKGVFTLNPADQAGLERVLPADIPQIKLNPFLDIQALPVSTTLEKPTGLHDPIRLVTIAMMRFGDKLSSYRLLAESLAMLTVPFTLDIIGDGEARSVVENLFKPYPSVRFHGCLPPSEVLQQLAGSDLHVWPAINEAFGMALLEAQHQHVAIFSGDEGGVFSVMKQGLTGELVKAHDAMTFGRHLQALLLQPERLLFYRQHAHAYVLDNHDITQAAAKLHTHMVGCSMSDR